MNRQVDIGAWRIGTSSNVSTYRVSAQGAPISKSLIANNLNAVDRLDIVVEIVHKISGLRPHALLAATFEPTSGDRLCLESVSGAPFDLAGPSAVGPLGLAVTVGLPPDLAEAAIEGFETASTVGGLPGGNLKIVGGGIDHDSSPIAFLRCGGMLRATLAASSSSADAVVVIEDLMEAW